MLSIIESWKYNNGFYFLYTYTGKTTTITTDVYTYT